MQIVRQAAFETAFPLSFPKPAFCQHLHETPSAFAILYTVSAEHFSNFVFPVQMSFSVVCGTPAATASRYFVMFLLFSKEFGTGIQTDTAFVSFQAALEYVFKLAEKDRLILAIDEYPYVARSSKSLASTLQLLIDKYKDGSKLMLILCGSSMSYMEDHVLAYKATLYGRRTSQMRILPFDFADTCRYFEDFSGADKAMVYRRFTDGRNLCKGW